MWFLLNLHLDVIVWVCAKHRQESICQCHRIYSSVVKMKQYWQLQTHRLILRFRLILCQFESKNSFFLKVNLKPTNCPSKYSKTFAVTMARVIMTTHWSQALLDDLTNPNQWILSNDDVVVVADKYPKAKLHYLVLPRENIPSIFFVSWQFPVRLPAINFDYFSKTLVRILLQLTKGHLKLLDQMYSMAMNVIKLNKRKPHEFRIGYHAEPSMQQLHLHVISNDFNSPTLKTQRHWNSFHTKLFIPHYGKSILLALKKTYNGKNFYFRIGEAHFWRRENQKTWFKGSWWAATYAVKMPSMHS